MGLIHMVLAVHSIVQMETVATNPKSKAPATTTFHIRPAKPHTTIRDSHKPQVKGSGHTPHTAREAPYHNQGQAH